MKHISTWGRPSHEQDAVVLAKDLLCHSKSDKPPQT